LYTGRVTTENTADTEYNPPKMSLQHNGRDVYGHSCTMYRTTTEIR